MGGMVRQGMDRRRRHTPWLAALFALFVGVFALAPVADALACAGEVEPAPAAAAFEPGHEPSGDADPAHGACAHGHCHHGAKVAADRLDPRPPAFGQIVLSRAPDDLRPSRAPDGLKRPPRD